MPRQWAANHTVDTISRGKLGMFEAGPIAPPVTQGVTIESVPDPTLPQGTVLFVIGVLHDSLGGGAGRLSLTSDVGCPQADTLDGPPSAMFVGMAVSEVRQGRGLRVLMRQVGWSQWGRAAVNILMIMGSLRCRMSHEADISGDVS